MNAHIPQSVRQGRQPALFEKAIPALDGFRYRLDLISPTEEADLVDVLETLDFEPFDFHGHLAHRHVVGFGFHYDYVSRSVRAALPDYLAPLRERVAAFAGRPPEAFEQVLINRYRPGAGIGRHRDKPHFDDVVGVWLLARAHSVSGRRLESIGNGSLSHRAALDLPADGSRAPDLGAQHRYP